MEPIIGALLAGLAMNRLIPSTSALMSRIENLSGEPADAPAHHSRAASVTTAETPD